MDNTKQNSHLDVLHNKVLIMMSRLLEAKRNIVCPLKVTRLTLASNTVDPLRDPERAVFIGKKSY